MQQSKTLFFAFLTLFCGSQLNAPNVYQNSQNKKQPSHKEARRKAKRNKYKPGKSPVAKVAAAATVTKSTKGKSGNPKKKKTPEQQDRQFERMAAKLGLSPKAKAKVKK
jgi:phage terminase small subunit